MTIPAYIDSIAAQNSAVGERLTQIYHAVKAALPDAEERISWGMPTFWQGRNLIHFAAANRHIGIYPGPEAIEAFLERLTPYKTSKGAWQIPHSAPLPLDLIRDMALWCQRHSQK